MILVKFFSTFIMIPIIWVHQATFVHSIRSMVIGDSVDRLTVLDWCSTLHGQNEGLATLTPYAGGKLQSGKVSFGGFVCVDVRNNNSLSSFSIFGSNSTGPYWMHDASPDRRVLIQDSEERLTLGLAEYFSKFPPPHRIFLQTAQWDNAHLIREWGYTELNTRGSEMWNITINIFERALNDRIDQVIKIVSNYTTECGPIQVGLRTAVFSPQFEPAGRPTKWYVGQAREHRLLFEMNEVIRRIAKKRDLILFDGDSDLWTAYDYDYDYHRILFRDYVHPREIYTATFGEKVMSLQYSRYLTGVKNHHCPEYPQIWLHHRNSSLKRPKHINKVYLLQSKVHNQSYTLFKSVIPMSEVPPIPKLIYDPETSFYVQYENATDLIMSRHANATSSFQRRGRLGYGDTLFINHKELSMIKLGKPVPIFLRGDTGEKRILLNFSTDALARNVGLTSAGCFLIDKKLLIRKIKFDITNETKLFKPWDIEEDLAEFQGMHLDNLPKGPDLPDIYRPNVLIRQSTQKEIFLTTNNGTKRSVNDWTVFTNHKWDLEQVVVVAVLDDMDVIPNGEPLLV